MLENGAGSMPSVIRPITNPGRTINSCTPVPCTASVRPEANESRPALADPYIVGAAGPGSGDRGEHHNAAPVRGAHALGQHREQADLGDVVGVHDGHGMRRIRLGPVLIPQHPECQYRCADRSVGGFDRLDDTRVAGDGVGVELVRVHLGGAGCPHRGDLRLEVVGATRGQHNDRPGREPHREFDTDLAAAPENHHDTRIRACKPGRVCCVLHGSDYVLR